MRKFLFAIIAIVLFAACNQEELGRIDVKGDTEFDVSSSGGNVMLNFETGGNWSIKEDYSWCHPSLTEGEKGIYTVVFSVEENPSSSDRTASFTLASSNQSVKVLVKQSHKPTFAVLELPEKLSCDSGAYSFKVLAESEMDTYIEEGQGWLSCGSNSTKADASTYFFVLHVNENMENCVHNTPA